MKFILSLVVSFSIQVYLLQGQVLSYFLPGESYNKEILSPKDFFGYTPGEWHVDFYHFHSYMMYLAKVSDRIEYHQYGKTHELKPNFILKISSPENLANQEYIRKNHLLLCDPKQSQKVNILILPVLVYQAYTVHGNEPSGMHAAIYMAYYYAACEDPNFKEKLKGLFILLEPCMNPDGYQRFATWVNAHKSENLVSESRSREFNETWPGGRTNHYWFDLNRDWLHLTQPESQGRIALFHEWRPNILTDHHEMGTNATYFFQPGVPSRTNPNTPDLNWKLTEKIAKYHGRNLDSIGSMYYSQHQFDDFFYGKGSTYPDIHGCIGILFEQASSRGHLQNSVNGPISFPFTIKNQIATSLSVIDAAYEMRSELLEYKRNFFRDKKVESANYPIKGFVFTDMDIAKCERFVELLQRHQIEVHRLVKDIKINNTPFPGETSYVVKCEQNQFGLIKTIFEDVRDFKDSIFYDVSAWTIPYAFGLAFQPLNGKELSNLKLIKLSTVPQRIEKLDIPNDKKPLAYVLHWNQLDAGKALYGLLAAGYRCMVSTEPTIIGGVNIARGDVVIHLQSQKQHQEGIRKKLIEYAEKYRLRIRAIYDTYQTEGVSTGHPAFKIIEIPKCMMIVGNGVTSHQAGEVWHFMDKHIGSSIVMIDKNQLAGTDLNNYNTILLVSGSYTDLSDSQQKRLEEWIKAGNTLIAFQNAVSWLKSKNWINLSEKAVGSDDTIYSGVYARFAQERGSRVLGGSIFKAEADLTHPLMYGYTSNEIYVFKNNAQLYQTTKNKVASPLKLVEKNSLVSGYLPKHLKNFIDGSLSVSTHSMGRGRVICFLDNPIFRAQWVSGFKMLENAIFFSSVIEPQTLEK